MKPLSTAEVFELLSRESSFRIGSRAARVVVDGFFGVVSRQLSLYGRFSMPGVGVFRTTTRKARTVRNPVTKELMTLPETRGVRFKAAKRGVFAR